MYLMITSYDPNPKCCGQYMAIIEDGEYLIDNNIEMFFKDKVSFEDIYNHYTSFEENNDIINYDYEDSYANEVYEGTIYIEEVDEEEVEYML